MGEFITNPASTLPPSTQAAKVDTKALPVGADARNFVRAVDVNEGTERIDAAHSALLDVRTALVDPATGLATKLAANGGDGSAVAVTPTGASTARTLADLGLEIEGATAAQVQPLLSKLKRNVEDATILVLGDSTGVGTDRWVRQVTLSLAALWPTHTVKYATWDTGTNDYTALESISTGSGAQTLTVYNASISGSRTFSPTGGRWAAMVAAVTPDLTFLNYGHNQGTGSASWKANYLTLSEALTEEHPDTGVVMILQNPATTNDDQAKRNSVYEQIATTRGYGFINVWQAWIDHGATWTTDLMADTVHPNATGSLLWRDEVLRCLRFSRTSVARHRSPSTVTLAGRQVAQNGDFSLFNSALPDSWVAYNGTPTVAKDTTNYEGPNAYSVSVTATGGVAASIAQDLPLAICRGKWVTVLARLWVDAAAPATAGVIAIYDGTTVTSAQNSGGATGGAFRWVAISKKIGAAAAVAKVLLYGDTSTTNAGASFDHVSVTIGDLPFGLPRVTRAQTQVSPQPAAAATRVWASRVTGQTYPAGEIGADGAIYLGPGSVAATKVFRYSGTDTIEIPVYLNITQALAVSKQLSAGYTFTTSRGRAIGRVSSSADLTLTIDTHLASYLGTGGHTFTLSASGTAGRQHIIKHAGSGNLTVARAGADTIDGATSVVLTAGQAITVVCGASTNWEIVGKVA